MLAHLKSMLFVVLRTPDSCRGKKSFFYLATLRTWLSVFNWVQKSLDRIHLKGSIHSVTIYTSKGVTKRRFELCASPTGCQPTYLFSSSPRAESTRAVTGRLCPHSGKGEDFLTGQLNFFTETAVTPERKVEKWFPRWEINRHAEG